MKTKTMKLGLMMVMMGLLSITAVNATAAYVFHETFAAPPLTAGTAGNSYTDGWDDGNNGWAVGEGPANSGNSYTFGQRTGQGFTGGDNEVGTLRTAGSSAMQGAFQDLPTNQDYTSGNVTFKVQNVINWWGNTTRFALVGPEGYATDIYFGTQVNTYDQIYVSKYPTAYQGEILIADASTRTTDNKMLKWANGNITPTTGDYATLSIDFSLSSITVTVSTTDAAGNTSSALPVSFATDHLMTKITRAGFFLQASPNGNGLVYMSDFNLNAVPEPATLCLLTLGGLMTMLRRRGH